MLVLRSQFPGGRIFTDLFAASRLANSGVWRGICASSGHPPDVREIEHVLSLAHCISASGRDISARGHARVRGHRPSRNVRRPALAAAKVQPMRARVIEVCGQRRRCRKGFTAP